MSEGQLARTVTYYLERTSHGSTLSGVVSAWVLTRYQPEQAWQFLLRARGQVLRFDPALPPEVKQLRFSVHYRGHRIDVTLAEDNLWINSRHGGAAPIKVLVRDEVAELQPGAQAEFELGSHP